MTTERTVVPCSRGCEFLTLISGAMSYTRLSEHQHEIFFVKVELFQNKNNSNTVRRIKKLFRSIFVLLRRCHSFLLSSDTKFYFFECNTT